jgi:NADH dehydrogenase
MNMFAGLAKYLPILPMAGAYAKMQPVYVSDVTDAILNVTTAPFAVNQTFDLAGPRVYTLGELVKLAALWSGHPRMVVNLPMSLGRLQALAFELLPGEPLLSRDNLASLTIDNVAAQPMDARLGVVPTPLESVAPTYLAPAT